MYYENSEKKYYRFPSSSSLIDVESFDTFEPLYFPSESETYLSMGNFSSKEIEDSQKDSQNIWEM